MLQRTLALLPVLAAVASAQAPARGPRAAAPGAPALELPGGPALELPRTLPGALSSVEAGGVQRDPYVAAGEGGALAVWIDQRAELTTSLGNEGGPDVYAMRLDAAGSALDPVAIRLPRQVGDKSQPKAAWNGSAWLVTWENQQPLGSSSFFRLVLGARVAADGTVLDEQPIVIKDDFETTGSTTAVASDGRDWVVVAQGTSASPGAVVALRVTADGQVPNPRGTQLANFSFAINRPDLEYADGRFLLVYASGHVSGLRFTSALTPLGGAFAIGTGSSSKPRAATDGQDFLVVWENADFGTNVRARRVTGATGAQSGAIQVTTLSNFEFNWEPDVAWNGSLWHVTFRDSDDDVYRGARIAPALTLLDPGGVPLFAGEEADGRIVVAPVPGGATAVWERADLTQPFPGEIRAGLVDDSLASTFGARLSLSAPRQSTPALAAGGGAVLVAFASEDGDTTTIRVQRLGPDGVALDAEPLVIAAGNRYVEPAVAWNGAHWLVVWSDLVVPFFETDDVVLGARIAADGTLLDRTPLQIMGGRSPAIAAQGATFLVAASQAPSTDELRYVFSQRVDAGGSVLGGPTQLGGTFARYPDVAPLGGGWIVTWQRNFTHDNPNSIARAALVAADGTATPDFLVDGEAGFGGAARPAVASAGDAALLVWQDDFQGLAGRLVLANGTMLSTFQVAPLPALPAAPAVAWNGAEYAVAWQDFRGRIGLWDYRTDVYATRVSAAGTVVDAGAGFPVAARYETEIQPALTGLVGRTLFAWTELLPDRPHATLRVRTRLGR